MNVGILTFTPHLTSPHNKETSMSCDFAASRIVIF